VQLVRPYIVVAATPAYLLEFALIFGRRATLHEILRPLAVIWLFIAAAIAGNDWADAEADRVNFPDRPIPSGRVSPRGACVVWVALMVLGFALIPASNSRMRTWAAGGGLLTYLHLVVLKSRYRIPGFPELITSVMSSLTFIIFWTAFAPLSALAVLLAAGVVLTNLAIDSVNAVRDVEGDRMSRYRSLAVSWGRSASARAAAAAFVGAGVLLGLVLWLAGPPIAPLGYGLALGGSAVVGLLLVHLTRHPTRAAAYWITGFLWGLNALVTGSLYLGLGR
jgi:geranylgeranylglycerol-phosphate geranylgeranyltransferase